jgi:hypothetical protein
MTQEEFQRLTDNCKPHPIFKLDWGSYNTIDFADTFLPSVTLYKGKYFHFYDGGELLTKVEKVVETIMQLTKNARLLTLVFYSYPKGVLAEKMKESIILDEFSLCCFMEIHLNDNVDLTFKFGMEFERFFAENRN